MTADTQPALQKWRASRTRYANVAGIDIRFRVVSAGLLESAGEDLQNLLNEVDYMKVQRIQLDELDSIEAYAAHPTRRDFAQAMRKVLELILPQVLVSPDWLLQAIDEFSESEIIDLYNAIMHGTGAAISTPFW